MYNLLVNTTSLLENDSKGMPQWVIWIFLGVVVALLFVWIFFSNRKNKMRQKEYVEQLDAIVPGNKVKTAGGICGVVVEVCDDNTVIIKTGSEASGYSFVKMEKELIAQTDAKGATQLAREEAEERRRLEKEGSDAGKSDAAVKTEPSEEPKTAVFEEELDTQDESEENKEEKEDKEAEAADNE